MTVIFCALPVITSIVVGPLHPIPIAQHIMAAAGVAVIVLQLLDVVQWTVYRYWRQPGVPSLLIRTIVGWCTTMGIVAAVGYRTKPTLVHIILFALVFLAFRLARQRFDGRLAERLRHAAGRASAAPPSRRRKCRIRLLPWSERDQSAWIVIELPRRLAEALQALSSPRRSVSTIIGAWVATLVLAVFGVAVTVAGAPKVFHFLQSEALSGNATTSTTTSTPPPTTPTQTTTTPSTPTPTTPAIAAPAPAIPAKPTWDGTCTAAPLNHAPVRDEDEISELYTGEPPAGTPLPSPFPLPTRTGEPVGRAIGGCTRMFHEQESDVGLFVWAWGQDPISGRIVSIATDSEHYEGGALFLAPAVQQVEQLIRRFGAIGGIRRFRAGTGDFYPVETPLGTYILIRRETGPELNPHEYELVPPVVAQAWAGDMRTQHDFFWPALRITKNGEVYDFETNSIPAHVAYTFPYHPSETHEPELGERELQEDANRAD
jgi:hypothetical protein